MNNPTPTGPVVRVHRSTHLCTSGCACRSWTCFECGTADLVDRRARYETEPPAADQYGVELCDGCGAPLCDACVQAGSHACPGPQARIDAATAIAEKFGRIDGDHHRGWVISQMMQALTGRPWHVPGALAP